MVGWSTNLLLRSRKRRRRNFTKTSLTKQKCNHIQQEKCNYTQQENVQEEKEEEDDGGFRLKTSACGVQPLGNLYFSSCAHNSRNTGLGNLQILTDELVLDILGLLDATHLANLSAVSKSLYIFCTHEPLWRNLVLEKYGGDFLFDGSWSYTYVKTCKPLIGNLSGGGSLGLKVKDFYSDYLFQSWLCANLEMRPEWLERDNILRRRGISVDEFVRDFEEPNKPVLLEGCLDGWAALGKWDREYLVETCRDARFAVGPVEMKIDDFFRYSDQAREERPLYLFDPKFGEKVPILDSDYEVPVYFNEDLFSVLGKERPDYRWIIIGPAGSGSSFHIDPNSTSAWNAVIKGSKKWVLFPPDVVPPGVHPSPDGAEVACPVSIIEWFMNFYSATKDWKKKPIECICKAGEVIFVPNGWWHLVINLEDSVAITQNFVSRYVGF